MREKINRNQYGHLCIKKSCKYFDVEHNISCKTVRMVAPDFHVTGIDAMTFLCVFSDFLFKRVHRSHTMTSFSCTNVQFRMTSDYHSQKELCDEVKLSVTVDSNNILCRDNQKEVALHYLIRDPNVDFSWSMLGEFVVAGSFLGSQKDQFG